MRADFLKLKSHLGRILGFGFFLLIVGIGARAQAAGWSANYGGVTGSNITATSTAFDISGNSYVAGHFISSTLTLGGVTLTRIGTQDSFIAKLDASGTVQWAKNFGGSGATVNGYGVTTDGNGSVYLGGDFISANLTTPAFTKLGNRDGYAIKMDSNGNTTWSKSFGGSGSAINGTSIAVDISYNVYLGGYFNGSNPTQPAMTKIGSADAYAIKMNSAGTTSWAKNFGGASASTWGYAIASDISTNVYLAGYFQTANLTTPAITKLGSQDAFAIKMDSNGNTTWSKGYGGAGASAALRAVATDISGNVYVAGDFGSANLTTPAITKIGSTDAYAIKYDSTGTTTLWTKNFGGSGAVINTFGIAVDVSGSAYLGGALSGGDMTTPAITRIGNTDGIAIKLDASNGNTTWSKNYGGSSAQLAVYDIAVDNNGNVTIPGTLQTASATTPALTKVGNIDGFLIKTDSSGTTSWAYDYSGYHPGGFSYITAMAKDAAGNVYLTGYFDNVKATFGGVTLDRIGTQDGFVVKETALGSVLWAKNYGGSGGATLNNFAITVDSSGNVYTVGQFLGANLTTPALTKLGTRDVLAMKLNSSGTTLWSKNFGGASAQCSGRAVAVDISGHVYAGGDFGGANLTTPAVTKIGTMDALALKLDGSNGNTLWSQNYGGASASAQINAIAVDTSVNVYLGGYFSGANLTTPAVTKTGTADGLAIKLDSSGNTTWTKNYGGAGASVTINGTAADSNGNMYLGGHFNGANLTTPALTKNGSTDALLFKLDTSGNTTWTKSYYGAGATANGNAVAVDISGNVYLAGQFQSANLTTPALTKIGFTDLFAVKTNSSGTTIWSSNWGGSAGAVATTKAIAADGFGNVHVGGYFMSQNMTTPALTKTGIQDSVIIGTQLFNSSCAGSSGKIKFDATNNVMVFCDGSSWQSLNNNTSAACTGARIGKLQYYSNGASSDFVWYAGACRSSKGATTYGVCTTNGKIVWDSGNSVVKGCVNGTWTTLKGW